MATKEELKAKRLQAMGVVGQKQDAMAAMFDRVIAYGPNVDAAIAAAEAANVGVLNAQIADMKEMVDDLSDMTQAASPMTGASGGTSSSPASAPAKAPSAGSAALAALQAAQPNPKGWEDGNAYHGTEGETAPSKA